MDKGKIDKIREILIENPELHARLVECLGEIIAKGGGIDGAELIEALKAAQDSYQGAVQKGGGFSVEYKEEWDKHILQK